MKLDNDIKSRLVITARYALNNSTYWKKILKKNNFNDKNLKKFELKKLPFLTKQELLLDQQKNNYYGKILAVKKDEISRVHKTSGTSTKPLYIYLTKKDLEDTIRVSKKTYLDSGLNQNDTIIHCLNFNMWSGGLTDYQALEATGAKCIPFGIGNTELLIKTIIDLNINAISCTPSYMSVIESKCYDLGISPKKLPLKKGFFGGESLIQHKHLKKKIENTFGLKAIDANYGLSEILSIIGGQDLKRKNCLKFQGLDMLYIEIIDKKNKSLEIKKGISGELVLSTLKKQGQPLFRYRTNDIIKIEHIKKDKFGKIIELYFNIMGRSDQMLIVKGVNFFPESIGEIIYNEFPKLNINFKIKKPQHFDNIDKINVYLDIQKKVDPNFKKIIKKILEDKIRAIFTIKSNVSYKKFEVKETNKKSIFI